MDQRRRRKSESQSGEFSPPAVAPRWARKCKEHGAKSKTNDFLSHELCPAFLQHKGSARDHLITLSAQAGRTRAILERDLNLLI